MAKKESKYLLQSIDKKYQIGCEEEEDEKREVEKCLY